MEQSLVNIILLGMSVASVAIATLSILALMVFVRDYLKK